MAAEENTLALVWTPVGVVFERLYAEWGDIEIADHRLRLFLEEPKTRYHYRLRDGEGGWCEDRLPKGGWSRPSTTSPSGTFPDYKNRLPDWSTGKATYQEIDRQLVCYKKAWMTKQEYPVYQNKLRHRHVMYRLEIVEVPALAPLPNPVVTGPKISDKDWLVAAVARRKEAGTLPPHKLSKARKHLGLRKFAKELAQESAGDGSVEAIPWQSIETHAKEWGLWPPEPPKQKLTRRS
jgi:hypothetical protein